MKRNAAQVIWWDPFDSTSFRSGRHVFLSFITSKTVESHKQKCVIIQRKYLQYKNEYLCTIEIDPFDSVTLRSGRQWGWPHLSVAFGFSILVINIRIIIYFRIMLVFYLQHIQSVRSTAAPQSQNYPHCNL